MNYGLGAIEADRISISVQQIAYCKIWKNNELFPSSLKKNF